MILIYILDFGTVFDVDTLTGDVILMKITNLFQECTDKMARNYYLEFSTGYHVFYLKFLSISCIYNFFVSFLIQFLAIYLF